MAETRSHSPASRTAASRSTDEKDNGKPSAAEAKKADKQAEENREASAERAAAIATSTASAAVPVDDTAVSQPPFVQPSTHTDKDGVERITSGTDLDGWVPAPSDPHPSQVEAADKRNERFEAEAKERQENAKRASD